MKDKQQKMNTKENVETLLLEGRKGSKRKIRAHERR